MFVLWFISCGIYLLSYTLRKKFWFLAFISIKYFFFGHKNFVVLCLLIKMHSGWSCLSFMFSHKYILGIYSNWLIMFISNLLSVIFNTKFSMLSICVKRIILCEYVFQFIKTWGFLILNKLYKSVKLETLMMSTLTHYQSLSNLLWLLHCLS